MSEINLGRVVGPPGPQGEVGPQGAQGIQGIQGIQGPRGRGSARFVVGTSTAGWTADDVDYLCDGTADQVEINAAIQALPEGGGEIVILDGTYNITASIAVNKDNVTLTGSGQATVLKCAITSGNKWVIHVTSSDNIIQNLKIDGNNVSDSCCIRVYSGSNNIITGNTCNDNGVHGIRVGSSSNNIITENICNNNDNSGIFIDSGNNNIITENICNNNDNSGIYVYNGSNNNTVMGNTCNNNVNNGIIVDGSNNNTVIGNMCNKSSNRYSCGISLNGASNNTVTGNTCNDNVNNGISMVSGNNNTVTGNTCNNNSINGIYIYSSKNNTISSNTCIRGTGLSSDYTDTQYTIRLSGTENNYNLIADNLILGKNYVLDGGTGNTFVNNKYE